MARLHQRLTTIIFRCPIGDTGKVAPSGGRGLKGDRKMKKELSKIEELALKSGKSRPTIYYHAKKLGRLPTLEELQNAKRTGRPRKYERGKK